MGAFPLFVKEKTDRSLYTLILQGIANIGRVCHVSDTVVNLPVVIRQAYLGRRAYEHSCWY